MDSHLQMKHTNECVTPNVPRIRTSFFNRKFRSISGGSDGHTELTPTTPKITNQRTKNSSTRSRLKQSGGGSGDSAGRKRTNLPSNGRPSRSRPNNDEFYDQEFSTPRATKTLLTPPKTSTKVTKGARIVYAMYQPLELDNESSSESNDRYLRMQQMQPKWRGSQNGKCSPLAIEAPRAEVTLKILDGIVETKPKSVQKEEPVTTKENVIETIVISDSEDESEVVDEQQAIKKFKCEQDIKLSPPRNAKVVQKSQYLSQPETPPDENVSSEGNLKPMTKFSTFIPGNCNIDDIYDLFEKQQQAKDLGGNSEETTAG